MPNIFTKDIRDFVMLTQHIDPAHIVPDDPDEELRNDVLCGMTAENHRRKASLGFITLDWRP